MIPFLVVKSCKYDIGPKSAAVLPDTPTFIFGAALFQSSFQFTVGPAGLDVLGPEETGEVRTNDLASLIARQAFCPIVPGHHDSGTIEHKDCVVLDFVYEQTVDFFGLTHGRVLLLAYHKQRRAAVLMLRVVRRIEPLPEIDQKQVPSRQRYRL